MAKAGAAPNGPCNGSAATAGSDRGRVGGAASSLFLNDMNSASLSNPRWCRSPASRSDRISSSGEMTAAPGADRDDTDGRLTSCAEPPDHPGSSPAPVASGASSGGGASNASTSSSSAPSWDSRLPGPNMSTAANGVTNDGCAACAEDAEGPALPQSSSGPLAAKGPSDSPSSGVDASCCCSCCFLLKKSGENSFGSVAGMLLSVSNDGA